MNSATPQYERAESGCDGGDDEHGGKRRPEERPRHEIALEEAGRIGRKPKPGAVTEGDQSRIADENVKGHAGHSKDNHFGRRRHRKADG